MSGAVALERSSHYAKNRSPYAPGHLSAEDRITLNLDILESLSANLSVRHEPSLGPLVRPSDSTEPVQRWFRYREGYTVELCRRIFSDEESFIIDPFCGFGSTLVAARGAGIPSAGLDVSPLATFVARVKTRTYRSTSVRALRSHRKRISSLSSDSPIASPPTLRILHKMFHPDILNALLIFKYAIDTIDDPSHRDFFNLAWIAVLERVSNVYREGNGIKYRNRLRRGNVYSVTPYDEWQARKFPEDKYEFVRNELLTQIDLMLGEVGSLRDGPEPLISQADASTAKSFAPKGGASLVLFSPPYCNCFNYIKAYKLELWMGGFIRAYPDIRSLTAMGVRSRMESLLDPVKEPYPQIVDELVALMQPERLWSPQLPDLVRGYFADMQHMITSMGRAVRTGGRCVIVVGNSAYADVLIPTDLLLARIGATAGFEIEELVITRHLTTSSQQKRALEPVKGFLRETIIHLRKT